MNDEPRLKSILFSHRVVVSAGVEFKKSERKFSFVEKKQQILGWSRGTVCGTGSLTDSVMSTINSPPSLQGTLPWSSLSP